jgi:hypothetical protein
MQEAHLTLGLLDLHAWSPGNRVRPLFCANLSVQLDTLFKAAKAVGKTVEIKLKRQFKPCSQTG